ncbi:MAG: hypothetical protein JWO13_2765 [Acidobacteriales bacterium]|nr:hypothetical protein [Terriglobales bacterium]
MSGEPFGYSECRHIVQAAVWETQVKAMDWNRNKSKCSVCRTPVRDGMPVSSVDADGVKHDFNRLCRRCLEAEKVFARKVFFYVDAKKEEFINDGEMVPRPAPVKLPRAA